MKRNIYTLDIEAPNKVTTKLEEYLEVKDYNRRVLFINDVIDDTLLDYIVMSIHRFNIDDEEAGIEVKDRTPIQIHINSDGGSIEAMFATISAIINSKTPVHTYDTGKAYSAGGLILMAGHKRFAYKYSTVLVHQGSTGAQGNTSSVMDTLEFYKKTEEVIKDYITTRTKITSELYDKKYKQEWFMYADEALEHGIIDEIIGA